MDDCLRMERFYRKEIRKREEDIEFLRATLYELAKGKGIEIFYEPKEEPVGKTDLDIFVKSLLEL